MSDDAPRAKADDAPTEEPVDWATATQSRPLPRELLDAMKHPDVPGVVLEAIARRSTPPPGEVEDVKRDPEEDTARYLLPKGGRDPVRVTSSPPPALGRADQADPPGMFLVLGVAISFVVLIWVVLYVFAR
ncbi:MAG: hypothetical protein U0235_34760 [Polyangiaceae bacterium]